MRRYQIFRFCMLVGAGALLAVTMYYFITYTMTLDVALANSSVQPALQASIRALWLAFGFQALLIGLLYALVAFRPPAVSREVIVLLGLLQFLEAVLLFTFAGNVWMAMLLVAAAAFVLTGAVLWPSTWPPDPLPTPAADPDATASPTQAAPAQAGPDLPPPAGATLHSGSTPAPRTPPPR